MGLAGEASGNDIEVVGQSGPPEPEREAPDSGKEMDLVVSSQLIGSNGSYVSLIHVTFRQVTQPDLFP
jgi:hypothetical protein